MTGNTEPDTPDTEAQPTPAEGDVAVDAEGEEVEGLAIEVDTSELAEEGGAEVAADDGSPAPEPADPIAALEARVAALEEESKANYDRFLRASADLDNFRKRSRRDVEDARIDARSRTLREMLPVIDNLERALEHADKKVEEGIVKGVELVLRQFEQALERCDVKPVDALGKPFDPNFHEAISQIESTEHDPGSIAQVMQRGYTIGNRLLRPSLVVVARAPAPPTPAEPSQPAEEAGATGDEGEQEG